MNAKGIYITGTDTGIGKSWTTVLLLEKLKSAGVRVAGMKPVASGAKKLNNKLINEDAALIQQHQTDVPNYDLVCPYTFAEPVSPDIAARINNSTISVNKIEKSYGELALDKDLVIVEGVGGWRVPYGNKLMSVDIVKTLQLDVIIVVGIRLGCINHARLTEEAIFADGLEPLGWIANCMDAEVEEKDEIITTLNQHLRSPCLLEIPASATLENLLTNTGIDMKSVLNLSGGLL